MMTFVNRILNKTLVGPFYSQHAFVLGLVYLIMFGAVEGNRLYDYHCSLIEGTVTSYVALFIVLFIWGIYFFRTTYFLNQVLENRQFYFLQQISLLPFREMQKKLFYVFCFCLLPVTTYAIAIIIWAVAHAYYTSAIIVFLFIICLPIYGVYQLQKKVQYLEQKAGIWSWFKMPFVLQKKWAIQFYIKYITNEQKMQYLLLKLITILSLRALFSDRPLGDEIRFATFFYAMVFLIHTNLIHKFIVWETSQMWHINLLPISTRVRILNHLLLFLLFIVPEILVMYTLMPNHLNLLEACSLVLLSWGILLFMYSIAKAFNNVMANFLPLLFLLLFLVYVASLADSIFVFSILLMISSLALYFYCENKFELLVNEELDGYM
jgi:hypothetical protein